MYRFERSAHDVSREDQGVAPRGDTHPVEVRERRAVERAAAIHEDARSHFPRPILGRVAVFLARVEFFAENFLRPNSGMRTPRKTLKNQGKNALFKRQAKTRSRQNACRTSAVSSGRGRRRTTPDGRGPIERWATHRRRCHGAAYRESCADVDMRVACRRCLIRVQNDGCAGPSRTSKKF